MTTFSKIIALVLLQLSISSAYAEVARPSNLSVEKLAADVPQECAQFYSETGWVGSFDNGRDTELWVEKLESDCTAQVVYSYGVRPGTTDFPSYVRVKDAKIENGVLKINFQGGGNTISVTYTIEGESLVGKWKSDRMARVFTATLNRR